MVVLVGGGVGAVKVTCGLRSGAGTIPDEAKRVLGCENDASASLFSETTVSNNLRMEWSRIRIIRSASSGKASTIQGYFDSMAIAGRSAPTESRAWRIPNFWFGGSFWTSGFFVSGVERLVCLDDGVYDGPTSDNGAAIANMLNLEPEMRFSIFDRCFLRTPSISSSYGVIYNADKSTAAAITL